MIKNIINKRLLDLNEMGICEPPALDAELVKELDKMAEKSKQRQQVDNLQEYQGKELLRGVYYLLGIYESEVSRLKGEIARDGNITMIEAYNKGRLYEKESFVDDLKLLLDEALR